MHDERPATFEQMAARLDAIVKELEGGGTDLDRAVALFKEGKSLARQCELQLKGAQSQIDRAMQADAPEGPTGGQ